MAKDFFVILTETGRAKLANAVALGRTISLTHGAVGDGAGQAVTPDMAQTSLVNEVYRAQLNTLETDPDNPAYIVAELVIPSEEGGWTIREAGVFDAAGDLFAVGNLPETYKPQIAEGSAAELRVRLIMEVSNTAAVELKVDPTVVLASRGYVDAQVVEVRTLVEDHAQRTDNPHGVTAAQAGAYTKAEVDGLLGALDIIPPGTVIAWVKSTPPDGFLECNGAQVSQTTYADLYAAIGTTFGSASGKFAVPDLRGEFIRGWDHGRGVDAGRGFGTAQIDQFKSHSHQYDNFVPGNATMSSGSARDCVSANTTAVGGDETRPRNVALMYCIKY